uniref:BCAS3 domain-containing protein n=1 Tax=Ascaris lumbricoides TaxID=6252 RepID=A0A9J2PLW5_ASCLU
MRFIVHTVTNFACAKLAAWNGGAYHADLAIALCRLIAEMFENECAVIRLIVQPQRHTESAEALQSGGSRQSQSANMTRSTVHPHKDHSPHYTHRGQSIRPQCVPEPSLVSSVAELVHDVIPQASTPQTATERIEWVCIQKCAAGADRKRIMDVIVIGLARGYQIWAVMESGDCEEVLSERQGPLRVGRLLATDPEPGFGIHDDRYANSRPLFAIVDGNWHVPDRQYCTLSFLSLITAQFVRRIAFPDPICTFEASTKILVVCFVNRVVICDAMSLREQRCIFNCQISDALTTPFAVSDVFLAYADTNLVQVDQSCGGMASGEEVMPGPTSSYTSGVMNVAKSLSKTVSALGETVVSSLSSSPHSKSLLSSIAHPGIVTVVDANKLPSDNDSDHADMQSERSEAVLAHFVAHSEPIGYLSFAPGGQILLTSGQSSTCFHIFLLYPHPGSPALGAVRHIYTLYRGTTPAKVLDSAFSMDGRWLALATNHGTTHVFAICPYGGPVTMRTHGGRLVNRESRAISCTVIRFGPTTLRGTMDIQKRKKLLTFHTGGSFTSHRSDCTKRISKLFAEEVIQSRSECAILSTVVASPDIGSMKNLSEISWKEFIVEPLMFHRQTGRVLVEQKTTKTVEEGRKFHRSAGLIDSESIAAVGKPADVRGYQFGAPQVYKEHPCIARMCVARSVGNPRIGPFPNPIAMNAIAKIRQRFLSADNLSAWASDLTSVSLSSGKRGSGIATRTTEQHRISVSFASNAVSSFEQPSLLVVGDDGVLTEYSLEVTPAQIPHPAAASPATAVTGAHPRLTWESPIQCQLRANASWQLQRCKSSLDVRAPVAESNPLLVWLNASNKIEECKMNLEGERNEKWITQIEVLTYGEPHRRLWTGPQFTFKTFLSSGHSSADLVPPGEGGARSFPGMSGMKSVPVMIEASGSLRSFDVDEPTQIVCGSWSSDADYKSCDEHYDMLREKIEEAMQDLTSESKFSSIRVQSEKRGDGSSDASQNSPPSGTHSSRESRDRDRDSISLQFANIDM